MLSNWFAITVYINDSPNLVIMRALQYQVVQLRPMRSRIVHRNHMEASFIAETLPCFTKSCKRGTIHEHERVNLAVFSNSSNEERGTRLISSTSPGWGTSLSKGPL